MRCSLFELGFYMMKEREGVGNNKTRLDVVLWCLSSSTEAEGRRKGTKSMEGVGTGKQDHPMSKVLQSVRLV
jgi:hypothetical protein